MAEVAPPPQELLFNPESDPRGALGRLSPPSWARQWLEARRAGVRPWGSFLDQRRFGVPRDFGELCRRLGHNAERFQSNYLLLFLGLVLYCLITSPLLLVALGVFVGAVVAVRLRAREAPLVVLGRELTPAHQLGVAGGVSLPLFWLAGAGAAVFWVLGAALVFLGSHAAFRQLDPPETPRAADGARVTPKIAPGLPKIPPKSPQIHPKSPWDPQTPPETPELQMEPV